MLLDRRSIVVHVLLCRHHGSDVVIRITQILGWRAAVDRAGDGRSHLLLFQREHGHGIVEGVTEIVGRGTNWLKSGIAVVGRCSGLIRRHSDREEEEESDHQRGEEHKERREAT